ncbi:hypothetical protein L202_06047 [Cryptococcus amylolentus CBS 6039]|uniref:Uncharacterized protein n=2 Tax=Cryptococcus amylolentus TaxID=104669 RepID=A0A1E3HJ01_9TREE|nr:hypothetical protein L202_06047 [Cryptococcus amylolentus CBS 6039]ODN76115.1 hypothetical protein L202_06047 [Cryptococcus amylolentus CBS 6039]ODN97203.1 hypothetical protein I350_08183 [Cryptococcus amylolentus CBS 6273]
MQSSDPGHLFQTSAQLAQAATRERKLKAAEKVGNPITLSSKIIDLQILESHAFTAESGWQARRVDLCTGKTVKLYKGHQGPVTSIALTKVTGSDGIPWTALFTGSWDKTIRVWNADSGELIRTVQGHSDFIKSLTLIPTPSPLLLSTSSDRTSRLWDVASLLKSEAEGKPETRQIIKDHTRPVECAAWKYELDAEGQSTGVLSVWTADSLGVIKQWIVKDERLEFVHDVKGHETSVARLIPVEDGLWSASMDKTAIFYPTTSSPKTTIPHPSYVKSILPLTAFPLPNAASLVLTGSEDEDIRIWDVEANPPKLRGTIQGHCGEVAAMQSWIRETNGQAELVVVSAGLDASIRTWTVKDILNPPPLVYEVEEKKEASGMTEEEERELAELMSDEE